MSPPSRPPQCLLPVIGATPPPGSSQGHSPCRCSDGPLSLAGWSGSHCWPVNTASVRPAQPRALRQAPLGPRLGWESRALKAWTGWGVHAGRQHPLRPAWQCQPPGRAKPANTPLPIQPQPIPLLAQRSALSPRSLVPSPPPGPPPQFAWPSVHPPWACQPPTSSPPPPAALEVQKPGLAQGNPGRPHHEDVRGDGPVRKEQCLPNKDADLSKRDHSGYQGSPPAGWQGAPQASHPSLGTACLGTQAHRSLQNTEGPQGRPAARKDAQDPGQSRGKGGQLTRASPWGGALRARLHVPHPRPSPHPPRGRPPLHSRRRPRCCSWLPQR